VAHTEIKTDKPKIRKLKDYPLSYLCGKDKVLFENGVYIPRKDFDAIKDTPKAVQDRLEKNLASEPQYCGFDWVYACSTGNLRRKKGAASLVVNPRTERRRERQAQEIGEIVAEEQKKIALRRHVFSSAFLVTIVMSIVGIGSAIMSAYHTTVFLHEGGKPAWAALMTGTMLILFSGTAFTAARYFFKEGGAMVFIGGLFIAAGFAVVLYSMFSTLTVNYDQFKWRDDQGKAAAVVDSEALAAHQKLLEQNREELDDISLEISRLEDEVGYWRDKSWARYDDARVAIAAVREKRETLRADRRNLEAGTPALVETASASRETIYNFLARLLGLPEDVARFFVYAVPAVLYDILAPFALTVVLLLADNWRKREDSVSTYIEENGRIFSQGS
jgi:hypothetical protein